MQKCKKIGKDLLTTLVWLRSLKLLQTILVIFIIMKIPFVDKRLKYKTIVCWQVFLKLKYMVTNIRNILYCECLNYEILTVQFRSKL